MRLKMIKPTMLVLLLVAPWLLFAADNPEDLSGNQAGLAKTTGSPNATLLNINNVAYWVRSNGISAHDPNTNASGVYYPRGVGAGVIYTDGLVWGGMVQDGNQPEKRVGGTTYPTGLQPGRIISKGIAENPSAADVRVWRVRTDFTTADLTQDAAELQASSIGDVTDADVADVRAQYRTDWMEWPAEKGAPYTDRDGSGSYEPDPDGDGLLGELETNAAGDTTYIEDIPGYGGADQTLWFVANDLNPGLTESLYGSPPMGMELQVTYWGYNRTDALGNVVFKRYRFIYKGTSDTPNGATIDSMFVAQFSDPDLGEYSDDFVGNDIETSLSYVYNSTTVDPLFDQAGYPPPAAGYDFLQGPVVDGVAGEDLNGNGVDDADDYAIFKGEQVGPGKINLPMTAFNYFAAGSSISDPDLQEYIGTEQWYNLMNGLQPRPEDNPDPFETADGEPTAYPLSGDPVTGEGDIDGNVLPPGDRRMQMISGPFNMALGDTNEVVTALVVGLGADRLSSLSVLRFNDVAAQSAYDNFFELPRAPVSPQVQAAEMDQEIILNWGYDKDAVETIEGQDSKGYTFQGYNLLQLPGPSATRDQAIKLATYDVVDEVTTILDSRFDVESGQILEVPVQIGTNSGIKRTAVIKRDAFTNNPLVNGSRYYFAVTAYNHNPSDEVPTSSLESSMNIIEVIPQSPDPGMRYNAENGEVFTAENIAENPNDGTVEVHVVDPTKITGDEYKVTLDTDRNWYLINTTTGDTVLDAQTNQTGDDNYLVVDGLQVKVIGPDPGIKEIVQLDEPDGEVIDGNLFHSLNVGAPRFYIDSRAGILNGELYANTIDRFQNLTPYDFELVFGPEHESVAWSYLGDYALDEKVPFAVYRYDGSGDPYRMFIAVYDDQVAGTEGEWNQGVGASFSSTGAYEEIYTYYSDQGEYDPAEESAYLAADDITAEPSSTGWGSPNNPYGYPQINRFLLAMYPDGTEGPPADGTVIRINTTKPLTSDDEFVFNTSDLAPSMDEQLAKEDVEEINVFPNPYYGFNPQETDLLDRFVTFNHLPEKADIRIIDLAGTIVRTLEKNDDSQFLRWDLANHNGLPVASGIYIVHIEMPDLNENKVLKLAVIREQEYLLRY